MDNQGFHSGSVVNNLPFNAGDMGSISGPEGSPGKGNRYPLQYSGLGNSMDYSMGSQRVGHD